MLDSDLAELYGVRTYNLNKAVKRNILRFPEDFMFQLTREEAESSRYHFGTLNEEGAMRYQNGTAYEESGIDKPNLIFQNGISSLDEDLKSQSVTSSSKHGGKRKLPYAFTEQGVAMLSSVLRGD